MDPGQIDWLQLGFSTAYTDAEYTSPDASIGSARFVSAHMATFPSSAVSVYARVSKNLEDESELVARVDYYGQTKFYYSNAADTILPNTQIRVIVLSIFGLNGTISRGQASRRPRCHEPRRHAYYTGGFALGAVYPPSTPSWRDRRGCSASKYQTSFDGNPTPGTRSEKNCRERGVG